MAETPNTAYSYPEGASSTGTTCAGQTEFDPVAALAFPLPANIVFSLIGVPERDYAQLKQWCGYRAALSWGRPDPADQVDIARSIAAYRGPCPASST